MLLLFSFSGFTQSWHSHIPLIPSVQYNKSLKTTTVNVQTGYGKFVTTNISAGFLLNLFQNSTGNNNSLSLSTSLFARYWYTIPKMENIMWITEARTSFLSYNLLSPNKVSVQNNAITVSAFNSFWLRTGICFKIIKNIYVDGGIELNPSSKISPFMGIQIFTGRRNEKN